jgi:hypothetical protein
MHHAIIRNRLTGDPNVTELHWSQGAIEGLWGLKQSSPVPQAEYGKVPYIIPGWEITRFHFPLQVYAV